MTFNLPPTMPAGVPWTTYVKMVTASLLAMFAGAEVVHRYYRPDLTIPEIPPKPGELKTELLGLKERQHKPQISQQ
ncbi:ubiquinol-cytochrome c reductase complex assembly factor 6 isoform X2 [Pteropus medius]|uniref:protein BRAWNIN isoform X2 n=1 Tax=Pteropus vampyrus TaxID=132908 RepID=UPI00196A57CF|nr:protein BRAWNIN isoform X2 [Pteropus giganteus]